MARIKLTKLRACLAIALAGSAIFGFSQIVPAEGSTSIEHISAALDASVAENARRWFVNHYDPGSLRNVRIVQTPDQDTVIVRGDYTFNQGQPGWVLARVINGTVQCLQFWDKNGCEIVANVVPSRPQQVQSVRPQQETPAQSAAFAKAYRAFSAHQYRLAWQLAQPLERAGLHRAQYLMAVMSDDGLGRPKNSQLALQLYLQAARQKDPQSEYLLGVFLGYHRDTVGERQWVLLSASQGYEPAKTYLQKYYSVPIGSNSDYALTLSRIQGQSGRLSNTAGGSGDLSDSLFEHYLLESAHEMTPGEEAQNLGDSDVEARVRERADSGEHDDATDALEERDSRTDATDQSAPEGTNEPNEPSAPPEMPDTP